MTGTVSGRRPLVPVTFLLPNERTETLQCVIDTGFTDFLSLSPAAVAFLGLPFQEQAQVDIADARSVRVPVHTATILWNGSRRTVRVFAMGKRFLLGAELLDKHDVQIEYTEGGRVSIEPLQSVVFPEG
jgi:clan AA aspartic protease